MTFEEIIERAKTSDRIKAWEQFQNIHRTLEGSKVEVVQYDDDEWPSYFLTTKDGRHFCVMSTNSGVTNIH